MAIAYEVLGTSATGGAPGTATLGVAASTLDSTFGLVAMVKRYVGESNDPAPDHAAMAAAGWTHIGPGAFQTAGVFRVGIYFYARRGNGLVNSVSVPNQTTAATNTTIVRLIAVPNVKEATFWVPPDPVESFRSTTSLSQLSPKTPATTEANSTVVLLAATGGTAGGTGFTVTGVTQGGGGSSSSTIVWGSKDVPAVGTVTEAVVSWAAANAGVASAAILALKTNLITAAPSGQPVKFTTQGVDFASMPNAVVVTAVQTAGPTVAITIDGLTATFADIEGRTAPIVVDFTVGNGSGASVVRTVTFAPGAGTVTVRRVGGVVIRGADGLLR